MKNKPILDPRLDGLTKKEIDHSLVLSLLDINELNEYEALLPTKYTDRYPLDLSISGCDNVGDLSNKLLGLIHKLEYHHNHSVVDYDDYMAYPFIEVSCFDNKSAKENYLSSKRIEWISKIEQHEHDEQEYSQNRNLTMCQMLWGVKAYEK